MATSAPIYNGTLLTVGEAVALAGDLEGIPVSGRGLLSPDKLGPGIVEQITAEGAICVRWLGASVEVCLPREDLRPLGEDAHLIVTKHCDKRGICAKLRYKIAASLGFEHNWTVELRPPNVVRVLRDDGLAWTFTRNPIFKRITTHWPQPPDDEDAEALTVAELATR